jgi:acetylglutamate kinase
MMKQTLKIFKIGGNIINNEARLKSLLSDFAQIDGPKILVHGGGKKATEMSASLGLQSKMVEGRRVTDAANLDVVTMVYAGLLNKKIVSELQKNDCNAIGLTGADGNCIQAHKRAVKEVDYGFVGDIDKVSSSTIGAFLQNGLTPVFCAITHDKSGQLLNTNADTISSEIAIALSNNFEVELLYIFELKGVLETIEDKESVIPFINLSHYGQLVEEGFISEGMLPKLHNCFNALERGVQKVRIGNESMLTKNQEKCTILSLK